MNLPNKITLSRLALTAVFVLCIEAGFRYHLTLSFLIFIIAAISDWADGVIARRFSLSTDFGKLMDPLTDKILTASASVCLAGHGAIPAWAVILIISREFLITGLRTLSASKGAILPAERLGKHKTAWQMITIIFFLLLLAAGEFIASPALGMAWQAGELILVPVTVVLSAYSGLAYLWKNRRLVSDA